MLITEMIKKLQMLKDKHGDLPMYYYVPCCCGTKVLLADNEVQFCEKDDHYYECGKKIYRDQDGVTIGKQY